MRPGEAFGLGPGAALAAVADRTPGPWLRDLATAAVEGVRAGRVQLCRHLVERPAQRAVLVASERHRVVCTPCALAAMSAITGTFEDHRCDGCGIAVQSLHAFVLEVGGLVVTGGVCRSCLPAVVEPESTR